MCSYFNSKLYTMSKARMILSKILPQTSKKIYTDISVITVTLCNSGAFPSVTPNNPLPIILQEEGGPHHIRLLEGGSTPHKASGGGSTPHKDYLIHVIIIIILG